MGTQGSAAELGHAPEQSVRCRVTWTSSGTHRCAQVRRPAISPTAEPINTKSAIRTRWPTGKSRKPRHRAAVGPVTTTGANQAIDLNQSPAAVDSGQRQSADYRLSPTSIFTARIARAQGRIYQVASVAATTTSYTDTASDATITTTIPPGQTTPATAPSSLNAGSFSYYVAFKNSTTGVQSQPTALIGPETLAQNGSGIELNGIPSPTTGDFDEIVIYRNTAANSSTFYQVTAQAAPRRTRRALSTRLGRIVRSPRILQVQLERAADQCGHVAHRRGRAPGFHVHASIPARHPQLHGSGRRSGFDHQEFSPSRPRQQSPIFRTSSTRPSAFKLPTPTPRTRFPEIPGRRSPGAVSCNSRATTAIAANALDITSSSFSETLANGTTVPINLGFTSAQAATGTSTAANFVTFDSLGNAVNVKLTMVPSSTNSRRHHATAGLRTRRTTSR